MIDTAQIRAGLVQGVIVPTIAKLCDAVDSLGAELARAKLDLIAEQHNTDETIASWRRLAGRKDALISELQAARDQFKAKAEELQAERDQFKAKAEEFLAAEREEMLDATEDLSWVDRLHEGLEPDLDVP